MTTVLSIKLAAAICGATQAAVPAPAAVSTAPVAVAAHVQRAARLQEYGLPPVLFIQEPVDISEKQAVYSLYSLAPSSPTLLGVGLLEVLDRLPAKEVERIGLKKLYLVLLLLKDFVEKRQNARYAPYPGLVAAMADRIDDVIAQDFSGDTPAGLGGSAKSIRDVLGERRLAIKTALAAMASNPNPPPETRDQKAFLKRLHDEMGTLMLDSNGAPMLPQTLELIVGAVAEGELTQAQWRVLFESYPMGKTLWAHRIDRLWRGALNGRGVTIALLDTGADPKHPFFNGADIVEGVYASSSAALSVGKRLGERATMAASVITAAAPGAKLLNVKIGEDTTVKYRINAGDLIKSHEKALRGIFEHNAAVAQGRESKARIDVVDLSVGVPASDSIFFDTMTLSGVSEWIIKLVDQGVVVVAAATELAAMRMIAPETLPEIITVGVVDYFNRLPGDMDRTFSAKPDLFAYGQDVDAAAYDFLGKYAGALTSRWSGPGAAAAQAAAAAALVIQEARARSVELTPAQVKQILIASGSRPANGNPYLPGTVLNSENAVAYLREKVLSIPEQGVARR